MSQNTRSIRNWQIERAKARGSARLRRAALALYQPIDSESFSADKARAGAVPAAAGPPIQPARTGLDGCPSTYPITEIGGNGAADTAVGCQQDCESGSRRHHHSTTETYMPTKSDNLKPEMPEIVPQGSIMAPYISPAWLLGDDAELTLRGLIASRAEPPTRCGLIWGAITYGVSHINPKSEKPAIRWIGEIGFQKRDGSIGEATIAYLPKPVENDLHAAGVPIVGEHDPMPPPFVATFSVECWCVPVSRKISPVGIGYETRNRVGRRRNINALAPPEVQALLPQLQQPIVFAIDTAAQLEYDPETGEISDAIEATAEAAE